MERELHTFAKVKINLNDTVIVEHVFFGDGSHQLILDGIISEKASYRGIAHIEVPDLGRFFGVTEYYKGTFPSQVFQVVADFESQGVT